jgi:hypothetical protein
MKGRYLKKWRDAYIHSMKQKYKEECKEIADRFITLRRKRLLKGIFEVIKEEKEANKLIMARFDLVIGKIKKVWKAYALYDLRNWKNLMVVADKDYERI